MTKNIILIGFMGTGKTTVGHALAERLGWTFLDTDKEVEELAGKPIPDIFADHGEPYFRELEARVIRGLVSADKQVVSTGGGSVLRTDNREAMLAGGLVVALQADTETIMQRVRSDSNRPLLAGDLEDKVKRLMKDRENAYDFAHLAIDTSHMEVTRIVELILTHST